MLTPFGNFLISGSSCAIFIALSSVVLFFPEIVMFSLKERLNISQLTEQIRKERGSASRRIVRERVDKLIEQGIVREIDTGYGRQIELVPIDEE